MSLVRSGYAVGACAIAAVLAGCSNVSRILPANAPGVAQVRGRPTPTEAVIYRFTGEPDGDIPGCGLTALNGALYGTTVFGGSGDDGTVFKVTPSGKETVLHSFAGGTDGSLPFAGLLKLGGLLYGTTSGGGKSNGTVYDITTAGSETILYSFTGDPDGSNPYAGLTDVGGVLYGTTDVGGTENLGTVFQMTLSGKETVLHSFAGGIDGVDVQQSTLVDVGGTLYGTTLLGGGSGCATQGCGTVFKITTSGKEKVLYSFTGGTDGETPTGAMTNVSGTLYGTTYLGGSGCGRKGCGTIFTVTTSGKESVLYRFAGGKDGANPVGLTDVGGTFYGTTQNGGSGCGKKGCGTVFAITPSGTETVLYRFAGGKDGANPSSGLTSLKGTLYGTTSSGGSGCPQYGGCGTVFSLSP
ncbi:MAG: choice-of-anchor tandem repeat GloVer-containing protein [Candidatus Tumulicola sp.]